MKPNRKNLLLAASAVITVAFTTHSAQAQNRYWDNNGATTAFGSNSTGTWAAPTVASATQNWGTSATGTSALANYTTLITDTVHFGTDTSPNGSGGGTITVSGTVDALAMRFGNQTTANITFTGGTINLGAATSVSVGAGSTTLMTINSNITGAATSFTKNGNSLTLGGTNTYAGRTIITAGRLQFAKQVSLYNNTDTSWTAANLDVDSGATLAFNVGGTGEFTTGNVTTLLTNLAASSSATNGMNAGSILGFDTTNAPLVSTVPTFTIADAINNTTGASGGARGLTKLGTGTLIMSSGTSNYTGTTLISGGTLRLADAGALGGSTLVQLSANALQLGIDGSFSNASTTLQGSTGTITLDRATSGSGAAQTHVFGGLIVNTGTLNFAAGSLVTAGTNPTIEFGTFQAPSGSGTNAVINPTTVNMVFTGNFNSGATATGTATYTLGGTSSGNLISGNISNGTLRTTANLAKTGASIWTLSGTNGFTGTTTVSAGALITTKAASLPGFNAAGRVIFNGGTIGARIGAGGWTTGEVDTLLTAGNATKSSGALGIDTTTASLTQWTDFTTGASSLGALGLTKLGTNTLTLNSAANNYTGATTIGQGTLKLDVDHNLAGALTFGFGIGTTSNTGTLDLATTNVNATFGALNVRTNSATANTITIGTGKTLLVTGAVTMGYNAGANSISNLTATGLGTLSVGTIGTPTNANVQIGAGTSSNNGNSGTLDLSGLSNFYANLGTGTFRIGSVTNGSGGTSGGSSLILAGISTIQATDIIVGSPDGSAAIQSLRLGSVTNTLNATNITVASSGRSSANLLFDGIGGNLTVRGLDGTALSRANLALATTSFPTSTAIIGTFDTTGHDADLRFETMTLGQRTGSGSSAGAATGNFTFNQGTLNANDLTAGSILFSAAGNGNAVGNVNLSGGTATFNSTTGAMVLGVNVNTRQTGTGNLNISGTADVTVAANAGTSIRLGDATVLGGSATGNVNITGGTLTLAGDIVRGATTGTSVATVKIAGGTLNMGGNDIGAAGAGAVTLTAESGTLSNVASINGTGGLSKTTGGTLTVGGTNTYTGDTLVTAGTLFVTGSLTSNVTVSDTATVGGGGTVGDISFGGGSFFDIALAVAPSPNSLTSGAISFAAAGFGVDNLVFNGAAVDWSTVADGTYTLLTGTLNIANLGNLDLANAAPIGVGRSAYFQSGSLQLVVIPEPNVAALIGAFGGILLLRRRR